MAKLNDVQPGQTFTFSQEDLVFTDQGLEYDWVEFPNDFQRSEDGLTAYPVSDPTDARTWDDIEARYAERFEADDLRVVLR